MQEYKHAYLDLTVLPELRPLVMSDRPAIVFDANMESIVWANAAGSGFFGGTKVVELLEYTPSSAQPFMAQVIAAVRQLGDGSPIYRGFRINRREKSELIQCELSTITLPDGMDAILLSSVPGRRGSAKDQERPEYERAYDVVEALAGYTDAAAILDEYGLIVGATQGFADADLDPEQLADLCRDVASEPDLLIKQPITSTDGTIFAAGIAHISSGPERNLMVLAPQTGNIEETTKGQAENEDGELIARVAELEAPIGDHGTDETAGSPDQETDLNGVTVAATTIGATALGAVMSGTTASDDDANNLDVNAYRHSDDSDAQVDDVQENYTRNLPDDDSEQLVDHGDLALTDPVDAMSSNVMRAIEDEHVADNTDHKYASSAIEAGYENPIVESSEYDAGSSEEVEAKSDIDADGTEGRLPDDQMPDDRMPVEPTLESSVVERPILSLDDDTNDNTSNEPGDLFETEDHSTSTEMLDESISRPFTEITDTHNSDLDPDDQETSMLERWYFRHDYADNASPSSIDMMETSSDNGSQTPSEGRSADPLENPVAEKDTSAEITTPMKVDEQHLETSERAGEHSDLLRLHEREQSESKTSEIWPLDPYVEELSTVTETHTVAVNKTDGSAPEPLESISEATPDQDAEISKPDTQQVANEESIPASLTIEAEETGTHNTEITDSEDTDASNPTSEGTGSENTEKKRGLFAAGVATAAAAIAGVMGTREKDAESDQINSGQAIGDTKDTTETEQTSANSALDDHAQSRINETSIPSVDDADKSETQAAPTIRDDDPDTSEIDTNADEESITSVETTPHDTIHAEIDGVTYEDAAKTTTENESEAQNASLFAFEAKEAPVRFAFSIDEEQCFKSVSPELAQTVGPNAADVEGRRWEDVARVFGFDQRGDIAELLSKRDTWSGKSVLWPIQGTDLQVPVDLAALPVFGAERQFEGFRGFGIIRTDDTMLDPESTGIALAQETAVGFDDPSGDEVNQPTKTTHKATDEALLQDVDGTSDPTRQQNTLQNTTASNVVHFQRSHDQTTNTGPDGLTSHESRAFREIGDHLRETTGLEDVDTADQDTETDLGASDNADVSSISSDQASHSALPETPFGQNFVTDEITIHQTDNREVNTEILSDLPVPVLVYRSGGVLFANRELLAQTGYSDEQELGAAGGIDALMGSGLFDSGQDLGSEEEDVRLIRKDGSAIIVNPILQTIPWDGEKALLLSFKAQAEGADAIQDKMALDMIRVSELQNILDTATDGIIVMDSNGMIESVNGSAEALFGQDYDAVSGDHVSVLFARESHTVLREYIEATSGSNVGKILNDGRELIGKEKSGGLIPLFVTIGQTGSTGKLCAVLRDLTQWKKVEEELIEAKRDAESASDHKSDFLARVSHEIRTPLNAIIGFSDVMIEERFGAIDNDRYREYLRDINRSGIHVLDLINDLLDLSKIEAGKMEMSFEAVDLNQIVGETVALLQPQANGKRIIIRTSLSRAVPNVVADSRSIRQIILNLVSNAIKFTDMNGQVIVSTVYEGNGEVALRVRDTGTGMSEDEIKTALKPFHQVNAIPDKRGQGTGLGLPLTKALVEANRAYFDIESEKGQGTIVHVQFPTQRVLAD